MRRIIAIALVLMMIVSMTACVGEDKVEISVVLKTLASEYWGYVKNGCDAAAKELGITVTVVGPDAESNIAGQVTMIEEQIAAGCDAIVCAPNDAAAAARTVVEAVAHSKLVADVTAGTTTTAQPTYNPIPSCGCCNK